MATQTFVNCDIATMEVRRRTLRIDRGWGAGVEERKSRVGGEANRSASGAHGDSEPVSLEGATVTPGLIDCHTHIVFAGNRSSEFEMRQKGASYQEIAAAGGGIVSTMRAVRDASEEELRRDSLARLDALIAEGVAVVEVKSGYGLTVHDEIKMLKVARSLPDFRKVKIVTSWLAAHAVPPEFKGRSDDYIDQVAVAGLQAAHGESLVDAVDGFCERIAFDPKQIRRVFDASRKLGIPVKLHAEQLSNLGGAEMAAGYGALSVDHLEYLDESGVRAIATSGTVAVVLPGAYYTLRETRCPPIDLLRDYGVPVAVASDGNPGSSPMFSVLIAMNMACTLFGLTPEEALHGVTSIAARALGLERARGRLSAGMHADFAVWGIGHPRELAYRIGFNPLISRYIGGSAC